MLSPSRTPLRIDPPPTGPGGRRSATPAPRRDPNARRFQYELRQGGLEIGRPEATPRRGAHLRRWIAALPLLALALAIVGSDRAVHAVKGTATQVQGTIAVGIGQARDGFDRVARRGTVVESLHDLEREHARLRLEVLRLQAVEREHQRLVDLVGLRDRLGLEGTIARVVARESAGRQVIRLDAGTDQGIAVGAAVVSPLGVVGQVVEAGPGWAEVLALTDPDHGLPAAAGADRSHGTLRGTGDALALEHVLARAHVAIGDTVVATGDGGVFPADVPVGIVRAVHPDGDGTFVRVTVDPFAPPGLLDEVLVVVPR